MTERNPAVALTNAERLGYFALVVAVPLLGAPLAVNGSAVFQILAIEELGLSSRQVGLAVGLGAISIPFQIWAGRIPLRRAKRNLQLFVVAMSAMCVAMAWLMTGPGSTVFVVTSVIAIAVVAELAVSVLFATSFQPLLSTTVDARFRQRLNAQGRAIGGVAAIGLVLLVGMASPSGRVLIVLALAAIGVGLLPAVTRLQTPLVEAEAGPALDEAGLDEVGLGWIFAAIGISVVPAWPFFVTYAADSFWPTANLGLVGAAFVVGGLAASALWRSTVDGLLPRARWGAVVMLGCALSLVLFRAPVTGWLVGLAVLGVLVVAAAAGTVVRMSLLEMAHARSTAATSVANLTRLDVIASTCMQVGFLAAGFLIELSVGSTWFVDPFQLSLILAGFALVFAVSRVSA